MKITIALSGSEIRSLLAICGTWNLSVLTDVYVRHMVNDTIKELFKHLSIRISNNPLQVKHKLSISLGQAAAIMIMLNNHYEIGNLGVYEENFARLLYTELGKYL
jgi:hypothetical protein